MSMIHLDIDSNTLKTDNNIEIVMELIQPEGGTCSSAEFINGDDDIVTCFETDDGSWNQQFLVSLDSQGLQETPSPHPKVEEEEDLEPPQPKVRNLTEAIFHLEGVQEFLGKQRSSYRSYIPLFPLQWINLPYCTAKIGKVALMTILLQS